jgi:hypothetical protein
MLDQSLLNKLNRRMTSLNEPVISEYDELAPPLANTKKANKKQPSKTKSKKNKKTVDAGQGQQPSSQQPDNTTQINTNANDTNVDRSRTQSNLGYNNPYGKLSKTDVDDDGRDGQGDDNDEVYTISFMNNINMSKPSDFVSSQQSNDTMAGAEDNDQVSKT